MKTVEHLRLPNNKEKYFQKNLSGLALIPFFNSTTWLLSSVSSCPCLYSLDLVLSSLIHEVICKFQFSKTVF